MIRVIDEELREACAIGDETKAQILIGQGANVNSSNKVNGWTALHWAAYRGHRGLVMFLLNKGADPTIQNAKGETVLQLLSSYSLDLLEGKEVEEGKQYPLPTQQETLNSLPIMPNYLRNPEFPYSTKKDSHHMIQPSVTPPNMVAGGSTPGVTVGGSASKLPVSAKPGPPPQAAGAQPTRPILIGSPGGGRSNSSSPQLPTSSTPPTQQGSVVDQMETETDKQGQGGVPPSMVVSATKPGVRYPQPHSKPAAPNWIYNSSGTHRPTMITATPLFPNQLRQPGPLHMSHTAGHPAHPGHTGHVTGHTAPPPQLVSNPHRFPVTSMPVSSEYPIQRIMRPVYGPSPAPAPVYTLPQSSAPGYTAPPPGSTPVFSAPPPGSAPAYPAGPTPGGMQMGGVPPSSMVHWGYNTSPHFRPQAGMVPQPVPPAAASPSPNPPLPSSPQVVNIPDSTQDKEVNTPVKDNPARSPSANSTTSSPTADATIKVRLAGSEDFFEVEISDIGDSYNSLVKCFAEELDIKSENVVKVRKLPNILIRKDRDVKRIKSGSEFEVELNSET